MTPTTLASLHAERDRALNRTIASVNGAKARAREVDLDLVTLARKHPLAALGGAIALGAATGLLLSGGPVRKLAKAAGLVVFGPLIGDLSERLLRIASGVDGEGAG